MDLRLPRSPSLLSKRTLVGSHALLAALALVACLCAGAQAEPAHGGDPLGLEPRPEVEDLSPSRRRDRSLLDYGLQIRLPRAEDDLLGQLTLARTLPGSHVIEYRGLQGFVVRRLRRQYYKRFRNLIRDQVEAGGLDHWQVAARYQALGDAEADRECGGRWWSRSWLHSLPPEKGGAPAQPFVTQIGARTSVLELGPLSLTNDFRLRLDGTSLGLRVDPSPSRVYRDLAEAEVARDAATYAREFGDDEGLPDQRGVDEERDEDEREELRHPERPRLSTSDLFDISVEALVPEPDLGWRLRVRPEARFRVRPGAPIKARVGFRASLEFSMGPPRARQRVLEVNARVRYDLYKRELVATFQVQFVAW